MVDGGERHNGDDDDEHDPPVEVLELEPRLPVLEQVDGRLHAALAAAGRVQVGGEALHDLALLGVEPTGIGRRIWQQAVGGLDTMPTAVAETTRVVVLAEGIVRGAQRGVVRIVRMQVLGIARLVPLGPQPVVAGVSVAYGSWYGCGACDAAPWKWW